MHFCKVRLLRCLNRLQCPSGLSISGVSVARGRLEAGMRFGVLVDCNHLPHEIDKFGSKNA